MCGLYRQRGCRFFLPLFFELRDRRQLARDLEPPAIRGIEPAKPFELRAGFRQLVRAAEKRRQEQPHLGVVGTAVRGALGAVSLTELAQ